MRRYEDLIGLTAVAQAQDNVIAAKNALAVSQEERREKQQEIKRVQARLRDIHAELDKTSRGEDKFLQLLTDEHRIIKEERLLIDHFQALENDERNKFHRLSDSLLESHEKQRKQEERTKYWSIIGTLIGATIGIIGTTINNRLRMRDLRQLVADATDPAHIHAVLAELSQLIHTQQQHVGQFIGDIKGMIDPKAPKLDLSALQRTNRADLLALDADQSQPILRAIKDQDERLDKELQLLKSLIATQAGKKDAEAGGPSVVYVGPDMESLLDQTERNLEWKMKLQTVASVVLVYAALAVAVPVMYALFRGGS